MLWNISTLTAKIDHTWTKAFFFSHFFFSIQSSSRNPHEHSQLEMEDEEIIFFDLVQLFLISTEA